MLSDEQIYNSLTKVKDPELGLDIVSLGLIYKITQVAGKVSVLMTMTFPGCPYGPQLVEGAKKEVRKLKGVEEVEVEVTFNPPWDLSMIAPEAKMYLGIKN